MKLGWGAFVSPEAEQEMLRALFLGATADLAPMVLLSLRNDVFPNFVATAQLRTAKTAENSDVDAAQVSLMTVLPEWQRRWHLCDDWLADAARRQFDMAIGCPVVMWEGVTKVNKQADFVLFNGLSRAKDDVLVIVEVKGHNHFVTQDAVEQAQSYAFRLTPPYYMVTNGDEVRVFIFRGAIQPDVMLMKFGRAELKEQWAQLYRTLNKKTVVAFKKTR